MKNKHIIISWNKIAPDGEAKNRMLKNIFDQATENSVKISWMRKHPRGRQLAGLVAAAIVVVLGIVFLPDVLLQNESVPTNLTSENTTTEMPTTIVQTVSIQPRVILDGSPVNFSQLGLENHTIQYPENTNYSQACLMAFSEDMIKDSCMVIIGTVKSVHFNYYSNYDISAVYELQLGEILYSEKDINIGDTLIIEQDLLMFSTIQDLVVGLNIGGTYLLPIREVDSPYIKDRVSGSDKISSQAEDDGVEVLLYKRMESPYQIIYPFMPPIHVVPDTGYLFSYAWESLVTDDASPVIMDYDINNNVLYGDLYMRDDSFIKNFHLLIEKYCNETYRAEHAGNYSIQYEIQDGMVKTTGNLATLFAQDQMQDIVIIDYTVVQGSSGEWIVSFKDEATGEKYKVEVPEYLPIPSKTEMIAEAEIYLAEDVSKYTEKVEYDDVRNRFYVIFENSNDDSMVRAEFNLLGKLICFSCFESAVQYNSIFPSHIPSGKK